LFRIIWALMIAPLGLFFSSPAAAQFDFEKEPILYSNVSSNDAVSRLASRLESGEIQLKWEPSRGWLPSLLEHLEIPSSSQTLVFSKTSLQIRHIFPKTPRAIFFNDETYLGWVPDGDLIELSSVDDQLGAVFYTILQKEMAKPEIVRDHSNCLTCHGTSKTKYVPGYLVRSVYPSSNGQPHYSMGSTNTDHRTSFSERFGGWYVTGGHGTMRHRGNKIARRDPRDAFDWEQYANLTTLEGLFDTGRYLESTSDIVALMVLEHQAQMHNLITRATYETKQALHYQEVMNRVLERDENHISDTTLRRIKSSGEQLLKHMLFSKEFELTSPVSSSSRFTAEFEGIGRRDRQGRSLRDFDLQKRLFKFPCSFLIYSSSYDRMPTQILDYVETRLVEVLSGQDDSEEFAHLSATDREAILGILRETKPRLKKRLDRLKP
jgi:hypothetical protein